MRLGHAPRPSRVPGQGSRRSGLTSGLLPCAPGGAESRWGQHAVSRWTAGFARGAPCFRQRWPRATRVLACPSSPSPERAAGGGMGSARHREPGIPAALLAPTPVPSELVEAVACFRFASAVHLSQLAPPAHPVSVVPSVYWAHSRCSLDTSE